MSLTAFSQPKESSRLVVIDGDTLMTFTKVEVRGIAKKVIEAKQLKERVTSCIDRERILLNINAEQELRYRNLKFELVEQESQIKIWEDKFFLAADEILDVAEKGDQRAKKKFWDGVLIGGGITIVGMAGILILAN